MDFNIHYEICSLVFSVVFIITFLSKRDYDEYSRRTFGVYITIGILDVILDIVTAYTIMDYKDVPVYINYALNIIFLSMQMIIPTLFVHYVYMKIKVAKETNRKFLMFASIPCIIGVALIITTFFTHYVIYFNENGYNHGVLYYYTFGNSLFYAMVAMIYSWVERDALGKRCCVIIGLIIAVAFIPVFVQLFYQNYLLTGVGVMLFIFLMYFTNENQIVYVDTITTALNRVAFMKHIKSITVQDKGAHEQIYVISLDNFKLVNEVAGIDGGNEIMIMLVENLQDEYGSRNVFRWGGDVFIVTVKTESESNQELEIIRRNIQRPYFVKNHMIEMSACIGVLNSGNLNEEEVAWTIEFAISKIKQDGKKGNQVVIDATIEEEMKRNVAIEQAIHNSIMNGTFEVHYQPIYDTKNCKFHSMEALARLDVPGYGYVSPEEFIRIAEKNGTILQIGILVIEEVCKFISENDLKQYGIEFVEINLSVVQCMQDNICTDILEVLNRYSIPPEMVNLEITESAAVDSKEKLIRTMAELSLSDITFSLDDYGSGYSNINYIVDLPFSIIKIDKYVVWAAMKNPSSRKILENVTKMFKDIHLNIVAEGIEDTDMEKIITNMGVDYLQGYHFSKPLPKDKMLEFLKKNQ